MTALSRTAIRPFYGQLTVDRLSRLARYFIIAEKSVITVAVCMFMVVVLQLAYPGGRTLPLQHIGNHSIGFASQASIAKSLKPYSTNAVTVEINNKKYKIAANEAGLTIDNAKLANQLQSYSWQQRLIPGSLFRQVEVKQVPTLIDSSKQASWVQKLNAASAIAPKDASLDRQPNGNYVIKHQTTGLVADNGSLMTALKSLDPIVHKSAQVGTEQQLPAITDNILEGALKQYNQARKKPLNLSYDSTVYTITPDQITAWSSITVDQASKTATITFDQAAIRNWLTNTVPLVVQKPGVSTVTMVNGAIQSRSGAQAGSGIDLDGTVSAITSALKGSQASASASLKSLSPTEQYVRKYTPTNEGLAAIINDWLKDYPGLKAGVALRELGGSGRQAALNGGTQYQTASIYKLFIDWQAFSQSEQGKVNLSDPSGVSGKSIVQCIEATIVTSDNPCGKWLGDRFGWSATTNAAHAAGYGGTDLSNLLSTPNDTAALIANLASGSLLNPTNSQTLLDYMQRQIFRSGIPAGSAGATVQDKVGILTGVWNDAAVVRGPRSSYVLVVYTNGNVNAIKDLASRIYSLMQT